MNPIIIIFILSFITIIVMILRYYQIDQGFDTYTIKKGRYYSKRNLSLLPFKLSLAPKTLRFIAIFGEGCDYKEDKSHGDINKLYGICYGIYPHKNSIRIGWRWNESIKKIELFSYCYANGKRKDNKLAECDLYHELSFSILNDNSSMIVSIKDANEEILAINTIKGIRKTWIKFKLYPYFGGTFPAPNDVKIFIKQTN